MAQDLRELWNTWKAAWKVDKQETYYCYSFGTLGRTLDTARATGFFTWFHLAEVERSRKGAVELIRFRPSGEKFHDLCHLDVLAGPAGEMVRVELVLRRSFLDGPDDLFAQDMFKSFLAAVLPQACQHVLHDFMREVTTPRGSGTTPGYLVFRGRQSSWNTETGWSRLQLANSAEQQTPCLRVLVSPNPKAPNASLLGAKAENS